LFQSQKAEQQETRWDTELTQQAPLAFLYRYPITWSVIYFSHRGNPFGYLTDGAGTIGLLIDISNNLGLLFISVSEGKDPVGLIRILALQSRDLLPLCKDT